MALDGCTTNEMTDDDSSPTVQKMSNLSGESDVHPQYITPEMQRFDPGIGDTGRGLGGGGADEQK